MSTMNPNAVFTRRYDLDWLRIIAFGLLIFYHIGKFFDSGGWHVKSLAASTEPEFVMMLLNPWRLALLFFISGVAVRYLSDKLGSGRFALDRTVRILPVIVFGMIVIVMPQTWAQLNFYGHIDMGIVEFWPLYMTSGEIADVIVPTWNHLWYVVYLFVYCLLLAPAFGLLRWIGESAPGRAMGKMLEGRLGLLAVFVIPALPFIAYRIFLDPHFDTTHNLVWDWANHAHRFTILLIGYWAAKSERFWSAVDRILPFVLVYAVFYALAFHWAVERPDADWAGQEWMYWPFRIARIFYAWAAILGMMGLARRFLTGDGPVRRYFTEAIFPYYILHQTIIVVVGYWIGPMQLGAWTEFAILFAATLAGCAVGYEIVRRIPFLRPVMGLKLTKKTSAIPRPATENN